MIEVPIMHFGGVIVNQHYLHTLLHDVIESYYDTGERLLHKEVTPNIMARGLIYAWLQEHPQHRPLDDAPKKPPKGCVIS